MRHDRFICVLNHHFRQQLPNRCTLFVCDSEPNQQLERGDQVNICLTVKEVSEAERIYDAMRSEGKVLMPLQPVYFSPAFGMVTDRFGVTFQVFTDKN